MFLLLMRGKKYKILSEVSLDSGLKLPEKEAEILNICTLSHTLPFWCRPQMPYFHKYHSCSNSVCPAYTNLSAVRIPEVSINVYKTRQAYIQEI